MAYWNTRGLRGSTFEEMINMTNKQYMQKGLAVVQKIPTPITPTALDSMSRIITEAYFEKKSTVDYIGVANGAAICFDAKETSRKSLPIQNIHSHQIDFMESFVKQQGIAFMLVHFQALNEIYLMPFETINAYWMDAKHGGRKSIPYDAVDKALRVNNKSGFPVHYLEVIERLRG